MTTDQMRWEAKKRAYKRNKEQGDNKNSQEIKYLQDYFFIIVRATNHEKR